MSTKNKRCYSVRILVVVSALLLVSLSFWIGTLKKGTMKASKGFKTGGGNVSIYQTSEGNELVVSDGYVYLLTPDRKGVFFLEDTKSFSVFGSLYLLRSSPLLGMPGSEPYGEWNLDVVDSDSIFSFTDLKDNRISLRW